MAELSRIRLHASHAICVYAEPLAAGRRVVVVGDSSLNLGGRLVELGARMVHLFDPMADRAHANASSARGVVVRPLPTEFDFREGAFDLALIPDAGILEDPAVVLARLRRVVGADGAVIVGARNPEARPRHPSQVSRSIEYNDLYDLVALEFRTVRMLAQLPFSGVAIAELGEDDEPEVSVDTQLVDVPSPPVFYYAVGSQDDVRLAPYAIVQMPTDSPITTATDDLDRTALVEAKLRADLLGAQLEQERAARLAGEVSRRKAQTSEETAPLRERIAVLEDATRLAADAAASLQVRLAEADRVIAERDAQVIQLAAELSEARAVSTVVAVAIDPADLEALTSRTLRAEEKLAAYEAELAGSSDSHGAELATLEEQLRERARTIATLEHEVRRREAIVHELLATLEELREATANAPAANVVQAPPSRTSVRDLGDAPDEENAALRAKLDALAGLAARLEGELEARGWKIAELERELKTRGPNATAPADSASLRQELDALRQALAQEHEAKKRIESGEELAKARAELARQATLLEQLSKELDARDRTAPRASP